MDAYILVFAAGITTAAAIGDRFGRRRVFSIGLTLCAVASAGCALAPSPGALILARAIQGMGAAIVMPLSLTLLTAASSAERQGLLMGVRGSIGGVALASGPLVGGAITQWFGWQWVFWLNVPVGLLAAVLAAAFIDESFGIPRRLDAPGVALVSLGSVGMILGLVRASDLGWANPSTVLTLGMGLVLLAGFVAWELRTRKPMLPMQLFANRVFTAATTTAFLWSGSVYASAYLLAQYSRSASARRRAIRGF